MMTLRYIVLGITVGLLASIVNGATLTSRQELFNQSLAGPLYPKTEPSWIHQVVEHTLHTIPIKGLVASTIDVLLSAWFTRDYLPSTSIIYSWTEFKVCAEFRVVYATVELRDLAWLALRTILKYFNSNEGIPEFDGRFSVQDWAYVDMGRHSRFQGQMVVLSYKEIGAAPRVKAAENQTSNVLNHTAGTDAARDRNVSTAVSVTAPSRVPSFQVSLIKHPTPVTKYRTKGSAILAVILFFCQKSTATKRMSLAGFAQGTVHGVFMTTNTRLVVTVLQDETLQRGALTMEHLAVAIEALWAEIPDQWRGGFEATVSIVEEGVPNSDFLKVSIQNIETASQQSLATDNLDIIPDFSSALAEFVNNTLQSNGQSTVTEVSRKVRRSRY